MIEVLIHLSRWLSFPVCVRRLPREAHFVPNSTLQIQKPIKLLEFMLGQLALISPWLAVKYKEESVQVIHFEVLPPIVHGYRRETSSFFLFYSHLIDWLKNFLVPQLRKISIRSLQEIKDCKSTSGWGGFVIFRCPF